MPTLLPVALKLEGRLCVIVGGGKVAERRAVALVECGARVRVVAPQLTPPLAALRDSRAIDAELREYEASVMEGAFLVVAATDDTALNAYVCSDARQRQIAACSASDAEDGDFTFAAPVRRGDLLIGISTGGASPATAARLADELRRQFGPEWAEYLDLLREARSSVLGSNRSTEKRREALAAAAHDPLILQMIRDGRSAEARARVFECISSLSD